MMKRLRAMGEFQPALPMRGVTIMSINEILGMLFQPALPMRGVT